MLGPSPVVSHLLISRPCWEICVSTAPRRSNRVVEALGSGSEAMAIVGQYGLFQGRILTGVLRRQVLAGLLGGSG